MKSLSLADFYRLLDKNKYKWKLIKDKTYGSKGQLCLIRTKKEPCLCPIESIVKNKNVWDASEKIKLSVQNSWDIIEAADYPSKYLNARVRKKSAGNYSRGP